MVTCKVHQLAAAFASLAIASTSAVVGIYNQMAEEKLGRQQAFRSCEKNTGNGPLYELWKVVSTLILMRTLINHTNLFAQHSHFLKSFDTKCGITHSRIQFVAISLLVPTHLYSN